MPPSPVSGELRPVIDDAKRVSSKPLARRTLRVPTMRHFLMRRTFIAGA